MIGTPTDPALLAALERAARHIMTPAEQHAQRRSWVVGQMGLSRPDMARAEIEALVDRILGPAPMNADGESCARAFARTAHVGQVDKAGRPYVGHLGRVAARAFAHAEARGLPPEIAEFCSQAGWLHDTIEDTATTAADLYAAGFEPEVVEAVKRLTRSDAIPYLDWIRAIIASGDTVAMIVKLADNEDNADPARQAVFPVPVRLLDRYEQSAALLREALS